MTEYVIVSDEGVVEDGFYSREAAELRIAEAYSPDDELEVELADYYDEDGMWIEESDGDEDEGGEE